MFSFGSFSYRLFGETVEKIKPYFLDVQDDIRKANMKYTLEEYISIAIFVTVVTFFLETISISFIFGLFFDPLISVMLSFLLSSAVSAGIFFLFYTFPSTVAKNRAIKIDKMLPFAASYLTAIASGQVSPLVIFKTLARFKEYGEITKEAENIVRDMEVFGMNFFNAIKRRAKMSPSSQWKDFLWGINTTITTGGDLQRFLMEKNRELMDEHKRRIKKYSQDLSLFMEIYLTLVIIGSIFFIVLTSIVATLGGGVGIILIQTFIVFFLLPGISIAFIIFIKMLSPTG